MLVIFKYNSSHEHKHLEQNFTLALYSVIVTTVVNIQRANAKITDLGSLILPLSQ